MLVDLSTMSVEDLAGWLHVAEAADVARRLLLTEGQWEELRCQCNDNQ
jgi:hypothetical protein